MLVGQLLFAKGCVFQVENVMGLSMRKSNAQYVCSSLLHHSEISACLFLFWISWLTLNVCWPPVCPKDNNL